MGDVGADVTLGFLAAVVDGLEPTPGIALMFSVDGGTAEVGLPGKVGPPEPEAEADGPAPVKSSSPSTLR